MPTNRDRATRFPTLEQIQQGDTLGVDVRLLTPSEARIALRAAGLKKEFDESRELAEKMGLRQGQSVLCEGRKWKIAEILLFLSPKGECILRLERRTRGGRDYYGHFCSKLCEKWSHPCHVKILNQP